MEISKSSIVVTGVSRGIGNELCKILLDKGATVIGWGRNRADLDDSNFHFVHCDIQSEEKVNAAAKKTLELTNGQIHGLVNNAGLGYFGFLEEMPMSEISQMINTNLFGIIYATRALLPTMKEAQKGHIINISSTAGLEGYQQVSVYCATKFAVTGFTDALFKELKDFGIKVTSVHPGATRTNFFDNVDAISLHDNMLDPKEVAGQIVMALESSDNYCNNQLVLRPLQSRPPKET